MLRRALSETRPDLVFRDFSVADERLSFQAERSLGAGANMVFIAHVCDLGLWFWLCVQRTRRSCNDRANRRRVFAQTRLGL